MTDRCKHVSPTHACWDGLQTDQLTLHLLNAGQQYIVAAAHLHKAGAYSHCSVRRAWR